MRTARPPWLLPLPQVTVPVVAGVEEPMPPTFPGVPLAVFCNLSWTKMLHCLLWANSISRWIFKPMEGRSSWYV